MRFRICYILFFCLLSTSCYALNCRTNGGPKESELKNIYAKCLKIQEGKNASVVNGNDDQEWQDSKGHKHHNDRENGRIGSTDEAMRHRNNGMSTYDDRTSNNERKRNGNDRTGSSNDKIGNRYDRMGNNDKGSNKHEMMDNSNDRRNDHLSGRNDFQNDDYADMAQHDGYYSSTQTSRRYKRERRVDKSGQRSPYHSNSQKTSGHEEPNKSDERTSTEDKSKDKDNKACALHCFLENLEMIGDDGIPDRYLVSHALTKDVKNEDLKDFLEESIEECFQILDNENTEDKCDFAKNLLMCLSEKGRANCDDWKDDIHI